MDSEPLSPVEVFLACAHQRIDRVDFVAMQCQLAASNNPEWVADLLATLREDPLVLPFTNAVDWLSRHGARGALSASFASSVCIDIQRAIDGIVIDNDWRAWWTVRPHVAELLDATRENAAPLHTSRPVCTLPTSTTPSPATPSTPPNPKPMTPDQDRLAGIVRRLSNNSRSMLRLLLLHEAFCHASLVTLQYVAEELEISADAVRAANRAIREVSLSLLESKTGRGGGVWLTPTGKAVALLVPPETCLQPSLAKTSTKKQK